jgi:hypothetical protein
VKEIPLTQGKVALVDDDLFDYLNQWSWFAALVHGKWYAQRQAGRPQKTVRMHRVVAGAPDEVKVDHINGNGLDNRRENLRNCSQTQNCYNRKLPMNSTTGFKGVCFHKRDRKYSVHIGFQKRKIWLGYYQTAEEAARAYDEAAKRLYGEFAKLNFSLETATAAD